MEVITTVDQAAQAAVSTDPRVALAGKIALGVFRSYRDIGEEITTLDEAGGPVVLLESPADIARLAAGAHGFADFPDLPEAVHRAPAGWVMVFIFTNDGGPTVIVPDSTWVPRSLRRFLEQEIRRTK